MWRGQHPVLEWLLVHHTGAQQNHPLFFDREIDEAWQFGVFRFRVMYGMVRNWGYESASPISAALTLVRRSSSLALTSRMSPTR